MGCNSSTAKDSSSGGGSSAASSSSQASAQSKQSPPSLSSSPPSADAPKLDPKDFMLMQLKDQTIVREPGTIRGQQFIIEECENCNIYLLDNSATVSIDDCTNCNIFVGPCESSVFVRNCKGMKLVIAAQQLRTRDCSDIDLLLYVSAGQPVVESTRNVRLGCFHYNYFGLAEQFVAAGLDPWHSEWSNVHDFTASAGKQSWSFIQPPSLKGDELLPPLSQAKEGLDQLPGFVTPHTWGNRPSPAPHGARFLVLLAPGQHEAGFELLEQCLGEAIQVQQCFLIRTRVVDLAKSKEKQNAVCVGEARKKQADFLTLVSQKGGVLGLELLSRQEHLQTVLARIQPLKKKLGKQMYISGTSEEEGDGPLATFFENQLVF